MENTTTYLYTTYAEKILSAPSAINITNVADISETRAVIVCAQPYSEFEIAYYEIRIDGKFHQIAFRGDGGKQSTPGIRISGLTAGTTYTITARAVNVNMHAAELWSNKVTATTEPYSVRYYMEESGNLWSTLRTFSATEPAYFPDLQIIHNGITENIAVGSNPRSPYNSSVTISKAGTKDDIVIVKGNFLTKVEKLEHQIEISTPNLEDFGVLPNLKEVIIYSSKELINTYPIRNVKKITLPNVISDLSHFNENDSIIISTTYQIVGSGISGWLKLANKPKEIQLKISNNNGIYPEFNPSYLFNPVFNNLLYSNRPENMNVTRGMIDNILNNMANSIVTAIGKKSIDLRIGTVKRTTASDASVFYLQSLGFTILN